MTQSTSLAIELLKIALGTSTENCLSHTPSEKEWSEIYSFAEQQAIIGVLFSGVEKLSNTSNSSTLERQLPPPMDLLMDWLGQVEYLRTQCDMVDKACKVWTDRFERGL